jgi:hypothetical protein
MPNGGNKGWKEREERLKAPVRVEFECYSQCAEYDGDKDEHNEQFLRVTAQTVPEGECGCRFRGWVFPQDDPNRPQRVG